MRAAIFAIAALTLLTLTAISAPMIDGPVGTAAAVWCGPDENHCCGEPITVLKKEIPNPIQC